MKAIFLLSTSSMSCFDPTVCKIMTEEVQFEVELTHERGFVLMDVFSF